MCVNYHFAIYFLKEHHPVRVHAHAHAHILALTPDLGHEVVVEVVALHQIEADRVEAEVVRNKFKLEKSFF